MRSCPGRGRLVITKSRRPGALERFNGRRRSNQTSNDPASVAAAKQGTEPVNAKAKGESREGGVPSQQCRESRSNSSIVKKVERAAYTSAKAKGGHPSPCTGTRNKAWSGYQTACRIDPRLVRATQRSQEIAVVPTFPVAREDGRESCLQERKKAVKALSYNPCLTRNPPAAQRIASISPSGGSDCIEPPCEINCEERPTSLQSVL